MADFSSTYDHKTYEAHWLKFWTDEGLFDAKPDPGKKPFVILMPPPNVTAQLHMGHGTTYTIQDLLIRWNRMRGLEALWLPGTDHAGIATQMMVEKDLLKEGKTRKDLGREAFFKRCQDWKEKYGGLIYEQFHKIGFSADWKRSAYTMDPDLSDAVRYVFVKLYEEGLIYRGERLVNWDPVLLTAVSDDELDHVEQTGKLYHLRYPLADGSTHLIIATTRPETMFGDVAVAVHPEDERYKNLVGKQLRLPLTDRLIPIISDTYVKPEFGTGALKITPAHDFNDFEVGRRHRLPMLNIMNEDATLNEKVPLAFQGMDRFVARKEVIKALRAQDLFEKDENYKNTVPTSDRSKSVIEPRLSLQWFVKTKPLAEPAAAAARDGRLQFYPDLWRKTYLYWLDNIQDWCISRQLWWGHRIPIWYCRSCGGEFAALVDPKACQKCSSIEIKQDEDVLDTWFSSWLWPLSPFGWPDTAREKQEGFSYFYPTQLLVTAPEIIFLWVARMVMAGLKFKGEVPFKDIYLAATVTDKQGRKFSKTLGNGIDPLEVIEKHGADAVRFTGVSLAPLGGRIAMEVGDFETGARFVNKLWNAARFLNSYHRENEPLLPMNQLQLDLPSKWLLEELRNTVQKVNTSFANYRLHDGVNATYHYLWGSFCDWGLECAKEALTSKDDTARRSVLSVLIYCFDQALRLLHPVMPFITEELWQKLPAHPDLVRVKSIVKASYPEASLIPSNQEAAAQWESVQEMITSIRSTRAQVGISPKERLDALVKTTKNLEAVYLQSRVWIVELADLRTLEFLPATVPPPRPALFAQGQGFECFLPVPASVDLEKEKKRLKAESERIAKILSGLDAKLSNPAFVSRAPEDVIAQTKAQRENLSKQFSGIAASLNSL